LPASLLPLEPLEEPPLEEPVPDELAAPDDPVPEEELAPPSPSVVGVASSLPHPSQKARPVHVSVTAA
jgi:hypothetical protein